MKQIAVRICAVLCLGLGPFSPVAAQQTILDRPAGLRVSGVSVEAALIQLQASSGVQIAYSRELLPADRAVSCECETVSVRVALSHLLGNTELAYRVLGDQVLIIRMPEPSEDPTVRVVTGRILSLRDRTPLGSAAVSLPSEAIVVSTDTSGSFQLADVPRRDLSIRIQTPGYQPYDFTLPARADSITVLLPEHAFALKPIVVVADANPDLTRFVTTVQSSAVSIHPGDVANVPGIGESDILRVVQLTAGTVARNDFSAGYNVRGGENDQNLVLLDGVTVFNPTHLGGFFSAFDGNVLRSMEFLKGGFPAHYSNRLSSVLDLRVREGNKDRVQGRGQVSLVTSKLALDGPIGSGSFLMGARRTYLDAVVNSLTNVDVPYYFGDLIGKVTFPVGARGSLSLLAYSGRDKLDMRLVEQDSARKVERPIDLKFDWGNTLAAATWRQSLGAATVTTQISMSMFSSTAGVFPDLARLNNRVKLWAGRIGAAVPTGAHTLRFGGAFESYDATYEVDDVTLEDQGEDLRFESFVPTFNRSYRPRVASAFVDYQWRPAELLLLRPGMRVEHVAGAGLTSLSPRGSFKIFVSRNQAITGSAGRYYQPVQSLKDQELPITIFEFWVGANGSVPVARSDQFVIGYERWSGSTWQIVVEAYSRTFDDLVIPNRALALRDTGDEFLGMDGHSWGGDVTIRRHRGRVRGWIAYGLTKTVRRADGEEFPASHDRRHTLNALLEAPGPLGATLGVRFGFGSPLPYTGFQGEWEHRSYASASNGFAPQGVYEPIAGPRNGERFPAYHRLDISLRWQFLKWGAEWRPYFQLANAYNRKNVFLYTYDFQGQPPTRQGMSQLPIFPTFGLELSW